MIKPISVTAHRTSIQQSAARSNSQTADSTEVAKPAGSVSDGRLFQIAGDASRENYQSLSPFDNTAGIGTDSGQAAAGPAAKVVQALQARFAKAAANPEQFHEMLKLSLGENYDVEAAESIRQQTLAGDFSWMPDVQVVDSQTLGDKSGAQGDGVGLGDYSAETDTIYISEHSNNSFVSQFSRLELQVTLQI